MAGRQYNATGKAPRSGTNPTGKAALRATSQMGYGTFVDRNLMSVSPLKEQFEPTDSLPVRQRYKMAGGC